MDRTMGRSSVLMELLTIFKHLSVALFVIWILKIICCRLIYEYKINKIPGPKAIPFIGDITQLVYFYFRKNKDQNLHQGIYLDELYQGICKLYQKEKICRLWCAGKPLIVLYGASSVQPILTNKVSINKGYVYQFLVPWVGNGLATSKDDAWRIRRKLLNTAFHQQILKDFIPKICKHSKKLVLNLKRMKKNQAIDIISLVMSGTLDTLCDTLMGCNLNFQDDVGSTFLEALRSMPTLANRRSFRFWNWIDYVYFNTEEGKEFMRRVKMTKVVSKKMMIDRKIFRQNIRENKDNNSNTIQASKRLPLLELLVENHHKSPLSVTENDIINEICTFFNAGAETTSGNVIWALYSLGLYPHVQEKLYAELVEVYEANNYIVSNESLQQLKYLDAVIKETLRLYPVIPGFARELKENMNIEGYEIPKGTAVTINLPMLHRDPSVFPNPEIFDPDRFLSENENNRHPYAYIPFSAGIRNCVGYKYAFQTVKIFLSFVVLNFVLKSLDPRDKVYPYSDIALKPSSSVNVLFTERPKKIELSVSDD